MFVMQDPSRMAVKPRINFAQRQRAFRPRRGTAVTQCHGGGQIESRPSAVGSPRRFGWMPGGLGRHRPRARHLSPRSQLRWAAAVPITCYVAIPSPSPGRRRWAGAWHGRRRAEGQRAPALFCAYLTATRILGKISFTSSYTWWRTSPMSSPMRCSKLASPGGHAVERVEAVFHLDVFVD